MCFNQAKQGFTLIELLVVVLIIGILAAVALPQYQKAVWKSRNTQLKQLARSVWDAEQTYYLANGEYATRFDQLDIDLPLSATDTSSQYVVPPCEIRVASADAVRQGSNFQIILNTSNSSNVTITSLYTEGPYKCQGFSSSYNFTCREKPMEGLTPGAFCLKIEKAGQVVASGGTWTNYELSF